MKSVKAKNSRRNRLQAMGVGKGNSRYAQKVASGKQLYGDGHRCCAHRLNRISGAQS